jgi:hypothetical protein
MARLLRRLGLPLHRIGPDFEYHGRRAPFRLDVGEIFDSVPPNMQDLVARLIAHAARVCAPGA